jgi:hypothetical protein
VYTAEAIPFINQIRARADMPPMTGTTQQEVRAQIEHERMLTEINTNSAIEGN